MALMTISAGWIRRGADYSPSCPGVPLPGHPKYQDRPWLERAL